MFLLSEIDFLIAHESVGTLADASEIDVGLIRVLGLEEISFGG